MHALLAFRKPFARRAGRLALALVLAAVTLAAGIGLLGVSGWFITACALAGAGSMFNFLGPSAMVRGLSLLRIVARYGERLVGHDATLGLLADLRAFVFRALIPLAPFLTRGRDWTSGDIVSRLTADVDALDTLFLTAITPALTVLLLGLAVAALMAGAIPAAALVVACGVVIVAIVVPLVTVRRGRKPGRAVVAASAEVRAAVLDGLDGHTDLAALGALDEARERVRAASAALSAARLGQIRAGADGALAVQVVAGVVLTGVLWFGLTGLGAGEGALSGPVLVGWLLAGFAIFEAAGPAARGASRVGAAMAAAARLAALTEAKPVVRDPQRPAALPDGAIVFDDVRFAYDPARPVLDGVSLTVSPGERVAIVGPSGIGKSTLVNLLLRLDDPQAGAIRIGGADIRDVAQAELHRRIALMSQDTPVFLGSVRDNLLIGDPAADDAACFRALAAARLEGFVRSLPSGLDTWLGEAGRTLSVGQARRLCLARALLSPAPVIVLDEPTSSLDHETESGFLADLATATQGRTVVMVTHAHLPHGAVDRVLKLDGGRLLPAAA
ncbi:ATP-binding cassette, subfamily C, CydC [Pseudoxanthobacter soli DSM 19599]|uniref:ATP-binding cassette, subfamily C, CydC n=1 Tax=Pseudoxanthobacter soli DSM 19599 TaxID=1123029 RepID=A0A1M7ZRJ5_9HYPH|nr:thiol reductant ABC exporter subunit CydC [Pseudoxanthobacter soli]SHO67530.1 ATP-binding cassette, subfamily C, CydC [Pseudoxanthobacter soli DSM 19599]